MPICLQTNNRLVIEYITGKLPEKSTQSSIMITSPFVRPEPEPELGPSVRLLVLALGGTSSSNTTTSTSPSPPDPRFRLPVLVTVAEVCLLDRAASECVWCPRPSSSESGISMTPSDIVVGLRDRAETEEAEAVDDECPFWDGGAVVAARALPLARVDGAGVVALGAGMDLMTGGAGGGGGLAYRRVHSRAVLSCLLRLRTYSVAIEGTGRTLIRG